MQLRDRLVGDAQAGSGAQLDEEVTHRDRDRGGSLGDVRDAHPCARAGDRSDQERLVVDDAYLVGFRDETAVWIALVTTSGEVRHLERMVLPLTPSKATSKRRRRRT